MTRFATSEDVIEYFGGRQAGTMRALVAVQDGSITGFIGIVREGPIGKYFCDISPELEPHLRSMAVLRAIKWSIDLVKNYKGPVIAVAEHVEGCRILNRLGFTHLAGVYYAWLR